MLHTIWMFIWPGGPWPLSKNERCYQKWVYFYSMPLNVDSLLRFGVDKRHTHGPFISLASWSPVWISRLSRFGANLEMVSLNICISEREFQPLTTPCTNTQWREVWGIQNCNQVAEFLDVMHHIRSDFCIQTRICYIGDTCVLHGVEKLEASFLLLTKKIR